MIVRLGIWLVAVLFPLLCSAAPAAAASGQGASYNVYTYKVTSAVCQAKVLVALGASGFQHVTVATRTANTGIFGDLGTYQAVVVCDTAHGDLFVVVIGPDQSKATSLERTFESKFTQ